MGSNCILRGHSIFHTGNVLGLRIIFRHFKKPFLAEAYKGCHMGMWAQWAPVAEDTAGGKKQSAFRPAHSSLLPVCLCRHPCIPFISRTGEWGEHTSCLGAFRAGQSEIAPVFSSVPKLGIKGNVLFDTPLTLWHNINTWCYNIIQCIWGTKKSSSLLLGDSQGSIKK